MTIKNLFQHTETLCTRAVPGAPVELAEEHRVAVSLNEAPAMQLVCTPEHLDELVVGRLLTEGLIDSLSAIESLYICEQGLRAKVFLREDAAGALSSREEPEVSSCCTDNLVLLQKKELPLPKLSPVSWQPAQLQALSRCIREKAPLYAQTHAVHSCFLGRGDEILCGREDIGRHNAVDKVVGWAALNRIDLSQCMLFTTGRMPLDMVRKAIRARVPLLASKTYPTADAVALAKKQGLTLVTLPPHADSIVWTVSLDEISDPQTP